MKRLYVYIVTLSMLAPLSTYAQKPVDRKKNLYKRLDKIECYHIGVGMDLAGYHNYMFCPKIFVGIGSIRNPYNFDFGLKLTFSNLFGSSESEYIRYYFMPFFLSGSLNVIRLKQKCLYAGAEISYNVALGSNHYANGIFTEIDSHSISQNHVSWQCKLGLRHRYWDLSAYYENDLSPALDQKYVYESGEYDYNKVFDSIFERYRIGLSVTYNFRF